jgi:hypothetical protein
MVINAVASVLISIVSITTAACTDLNSTGNSSHSRSHHPITVDMPKNLENALNGGIFQDSKGDEWTIADVRAWEKYEKKLKALSKNQGVKASIVIKNDNEADLVISFEPLKLSVKRNSESLEESKEKRIKHMMIKSQNLEGIKQRFPE